MSTQGALPRRQRVAAYAVILRVGESAEEILLSRLAPYLTASESWTLPGGGIDFGEHPHDAVVREVHEETGLEVTVGELAWIDSARRQSADSGSGLGTDLHSVRIVYDGWVREDSPVPRVVEEDGSTVDARWHLVTEVLAGKVPTVPLVREALSRHQPQRLQRLAAYALVRRDDQVLLTRISAHGFHSGAWTLPGGGVDHGEPPAAAVAREVFEETGLRAEVGGLLGVHDQHFTGRSPGGSMEDFHGVHLVYAASVGTGEPRVTEVDGTADAVAWVPVADVESGEVPVLDLVLFALQQPR